MSIKQTKRFDTLGRETKLIVEALLEDMRTNITHDIRQEIEGLAQLLNRRDVVVFDSGKEQRVIVDAFHELDPGNEGILPEYEKEKRFRASINKHILQSLYFSASTERYEVVHDAHATTFQWIFHMNSDEDYPWDNFVKWLEQSDGLYWINGKAGSGKSTLMKYIWNRHLTRKHLSTWAGDSRLCIAHFYFWDLGSEKLQKSQLGLFRSLLHQILSDLPQLTPLVFPQRWAENYTLKSLSNELKVFRSPPHLRFLSFFCIKATMPSTLLMAMFRVFCRRLTMK
jgi:hypothetical protein